MSVVIGTSLYVRHDDRTAEVERPSWLRVILAWPRRPVKRRAHKHAGGCGRFAAPAHLRGPPRVGSCLAGRYPATGTRLNQFRSRAVAPPVHRAPVHVRQRHRGPVGPASLVERAWIPDLATVLSMSAPSSAPIRFDRRAPGSSAGSRVAT